MTQQYSHHLLYTALALKKCADGLVLTGCNDKLIRAFAGGSPDPVFHVEGHTVCGDRACFKLRVECGTPID